MNKLFIFIFAAFSSSLLFADEAVGSQSTGYMSSLIMILLAVVFFYFILWRPEQKRRKSQQKQRESLKVGDRVTAMGILGTIDKIEENTIILKTYDDSKIEMLKAAITDVKSQGEEEKTVEMPKKK